MNTFEQSIGYQFHDRELLLTALTHSSYVNEHPKEHLESYERLEFLGDSILGLVTAEYLYHRNPPIPEGRMTRIRAELVCEESLFAVADTLNIGHYMRLGRGEEKSEGRKRPSILADMVEAVIAAISIDGGMEAARLFILKHVLRNAEDKILSRSRDHKTELQELVQKTPNSKIQYELTGETGPDHLKTFTYTVFVNGSPVGTGSGHSKKEAEQAAAGDALSKL
ncbi:MAG: ribonuclease III [Oscillospiraceae bacterium]|nr:ribonuclease III [Oscillospiraceae bacterium]